MSVRSIGGMGLVMMCAVSGCVLEPDDAPDGALDERAPGPPAIAGCPVTAGVYDPYDDGGANPIGTVSQLPWRGRNPYPGGLEDFRGYGDLPVRVECASDKHRRSHLDVTAGCLDAVEVGGYTRGRIRTTRDGYFRAVALARDAGDPLPVKWTDQAIEYRFHHAGKTGTNGNPGFKAFVRYRSEDDLYVASWRFDGVVQIQRKRCGEYTTLAMIPDFGAPTEGHWHTIRFAAVGDRLHLHLDGDGVLSATASTFSWGTAGVRVDSVNGAYVDDWRVFEP